MCKRFFEQRPIKTRFLFVKTQGVITVSKDSKSNVYFNITLKSNIGKRAGPNYLRFIKQKQLNISELLEYASGEGDEIYMKNMCPH